MSQAQHVRVAEAQPEEEQEEERLSPALPSPEPVPSRTTGEQAPLEPLSDRVSSLFDPHAFLDGDDDDESDESDDDDDHDGKRDSDDCQDAVIHQAEHDSQPLESLRSRVSSSFDPNAFFDDDEEEDSDAEDSEAEAEAEAEADLPESLPNLNARVSNSFDPSAFLDSDDEDDDDVTTEANRDEVEAVHEKAIATSAEAQTVLPAEVAVVLPKPEAVPTAQRRSVFRRRAAPKPSPEPTPQGTAETAPRCASSASAVEAGATISSASEAAVSPGVSSDRHVEGDTLEARQRRTRQEAQQVLARLRQAEQDATPPRATEQDQTDDAVGDDASRRLLALSSDGAVDEVYTPKKHTEREHASPDSAFGSGSPGTPRTRARRRRARSPKPMSPRLDPSDYARQRREALEHARLVRESQAGKGKLGLGSRTPPSSQQAPDREHLTGSAESWRRRAATQARESRLSSRLQRAVVERAKEEKEAQARQAYEQWQQLNQACALRDGLRGGGHIEGVLEASLVAFQLASVAQRRALSVDLVTMITELGDEKLAALPAHASDDDPATPKRTDSCLSVASAYTRGANMLLEFPAHVSGVSRSLAAELLAHAQQLASSSGREDATALREARARVAARTAHVRQAQEMIREREVSCVHTTLILFHAPLSIVLTAVHTNELRGSHALLTAFLRVRRWNKSSRASDDRRWMSG